MAKLNHILKFLLCTALLYSNTLYAHSLSENNARITLRDGQVEIRLFVNWDRWLDQLKSHKAWLLGDIRHPMPSKLSDDEQDLFLTDVLSTETVLEIGTYQVPLIISQFPNAKSRGHYTPITLSGEHNAHDPKTLRVTFPKSLGSLHASFVKPTYQMIKAGSSASVILTSKPRNFIANTNNAIKKEEVKQ